MKKPSPYNKNTTSPPSTTARQSLSNKKVTLENYETAREHLLAKVVPDEVQEAPSNIIAYIILSMPLEALLLLLLHLLLLLL